MNTATPDQLDIVKQAFQEWRDTRPKVGKIPTYLWEASSFSGFGIKKELKAEE